MRAPPQFSSIRQHCIISLTVTVEQQDSTGLMSSKEITRLLVKILKLVPTVNNELPQYLQMLHKVPARANKQIQNKQL